MEAIVLVAILAIAAAVFVASFVVGAMLIRRNAKRQLRVAPGTASRAPSNWVGSHSPEARLHRRVIAATTRLRAVAETHPVLAETVAAVEADAVALDEELVATAAIDGRTDPAAKQAVLADLTAATEAIEAMADRAIAATRTTAEPTIRASLEARTVELDDRLAAIRAARQELDRLDPPS